MHRRHRHRLAEAEPGELPHVGLAPLVVDLVHDDDDRRLALLEQARDACVLLGDAGRDVDDEEHEVGVLHRGRGLRADLGRELGLLAGEPGLARREPAAGVDDAERAAVPLAPGAPCGRA